jgi:two-component system cell cycle sensor histidine kinase/response regulator CckA
MARTETINPRTVLVVDDEHDILMLLKLILETHGYRALLARGAMEALQLLGQDDLELDLLLTDVVMPGMDGMDLARTCRELRPGLPVLFMSGFVDAEVVRLKIWDDGVRFLRKPFTEETIVDQVCELLGAVPLPTCKPQKARAASVN